MSLEIIPALDLHGGRVVRLEQGDYARQTTFAIDAVEQARKWHAHGVQRVHVVDLEGARDGGLRNLLVIEALAALGLQVQAGGGVRVEGDLQRLFDAGVHRAVVGSVAIREPQRVIDWIGKHGAGRIVIALDARRRDESWSLASAGWTAPADTTLEELAPRFAEAGALHLLCTDIDRDGMLAGPNLDLYRHLGRLAPDLRVQASGGVRDLGDVHALRATPAAAVIVGRSLLEGRFDLAAALAC